MGQPSRADELQVELLGPLVVSRPVGGPITVPSRPQRRLLAVLALHVDEIVRSVSLEEWLALSPGALRTSVSRLRRVIGADALETTALGYRLRAEVDVVAFERRVSLAPDVGDDAARAALEGAIRLWRGDPLVEHAGERWAEPVLRRLSELHASTVEDLAVLQLDAGEVSAALVAVQALVDREPFRERSQALLMRALAEGGRWTEALRAFHTYRRLLAHEVGTEPSGALVELDRAIAASVESSTSIDRRPGHPAWTRARRAAPAAGVAHHRGPPVPLSSFVGRRQDLATVLDLVRTHRLVTLTGSGGCGKTRLAIAAAAAEADRRRTSVRWVELGVVPAAADVVEHVAAAVGLTPQPRGDPTQLIDHLAEGRPVLLVLDNAEHVLAPVTELLTALLPHCRSLRVLVTSREPLGIAGESVWRVPSLATPPAHTSLAADDLPSYDALQLFVERAREARPGIVIDADALHHVAAICTGVDGLPLAVELAAARTRTLPIEAVAAGITDAVRWQATGSRAPLGRHATLHASIAWSVDLIGPLARSVLARLAVFQAPFTLEAALAVGGDGEPTDQVVDAVGALVDASLLQFDDATGRFRMLLTVRRFCAVRAQAGAELARARARHAHHLAAFCADVGAGRRGIERGRFIREMPDLVAAMEWAREHEPRLVFAMCAGVAPVRSALGHHTNVADTWAWLLSLDRGAGTNGDAGTRAWSEEWATAVAAQMAAATAHRVDVSLVAEEVDRLLPADAHRARGWLARGGAMLPAYQGRLAPILAHVEEARGRRDDLEDSIYGGFAAYMLALVGRLDESDRHIHELARLTRRHRTTFRVDTVGNGYAAAVIVDLLRGDLRSAIGRSDQPIPDDPAFSMTAAAALAHVALVAGDRRTLARAIEWSRQRTIPLLGYLPTFIELVGRRLDGELDGGSDQAADLAEQFWEEAAPVPVSRVHPLPLLTTALVEAGRTAPAIAMTEEASWLVDGMEPAPLLSAGVLASRALLAAHAGSVREAAPCLGALLAITTAHGFAPMTIEALEHIAAIADDPALAATLRTAADDERRRIGARRLQPAEGVAPTGAPVPFHDAVVLAREWIAHVASAVALPDAHL
jgi:predicted ATPase/DNA-binding SARP family transcriptional activator